MITLERLVQFSKASCPRLLTLFGITILERLTQLEKAASTLADYKTLTQFQWTERMVGTYKEVERKAKHLIFLSFEANALVFSFTHILSVLFLKSRM